MTQNFYNPLLERYPRNPRTNITRLMRNILIEKRILHIRTCKVDYKFTCVNVLKSVLYAFKIQMCEKFWKKL
jgi:hypothetical protein